MQMDINDYTVRVDSAKLREIRKRAKYTQTEIAEKLNITMGSYQSKETGRCAFKDREKFMLADLFGMTYDEFDDVMFGGKLKVMR